MELLDEVGLKIIEVPIRGIWFKFPEFTYILTNHLENHMGIKKISKCNIYRNGKKGRGAITAVNVDGLIEWLSRSLSMTPHDKKRVLNYLDKKGIKYNPNVLISTTKELSFFGELQYVFDELELGIIKRQYTVEPYVVDGLWKDLVIEFDENKHMSYNNIKEATREKSIKDSGYRIVRIDDSMPIGKAIGIILSNLKK